MTTREHQAFNDGRLAFRSGEECSRRAIALRAAWRKGFEHERKLDLGAKINDAQRVEAAGVVRRLKEWAAENFAEEKPC